MQIVIIVGLLACVCLGVVQSATSTTAHAAGVTTHHETSTHHTDHSGSSPLSMALWVNVVMLLVAVCVQRL